MKSTASLVLLASIGISSAVFGEWQRLPFSETVPVNLANRAIPGTSLLSSEGIGSVNSLISAGVSEPVALPSGKSEAVIQVVGQHVIDEVRFTNDGAEGKVSVASSIDAKKWQPVGQTVFVSNMNEVVVRFAGAQARYVRVNFDLAKGSTIRGFAIYGATTDKQYKLVEREVDSTGGAASGQPAAGGGNAAKEPAAAGANAPKETKNEGGSGSTVNLTAGGGAKAIYAFPQPINTDETELRKNVFRFPKSKERFRVIIYDLGSARKIKQFASAYSERPTRLEVFAFEQLPEKKDWRGKMTLDPAIFAQTKPVAVGEDARGVGHIKLVPENPVSAQFVALRFEPNYNRQVNTSDDQEEWSAGLAMAMIPFFDLVRGTNLFEGSRMVAADDLVTLTFRGRTIQVPQYLVQRYLSAGATLVVPNQPPAAALPAVEGEFLDILGLEIDVVSFNNLKLRLQNLFPADGSVTTGEAVKAVSDTQTPGSFINQYNSRSNAAGSGNTPGTDALFNALARQNFRPTNQEDLRRLLRTLQRSFVRDEDGDGSGVIATTP